MMCSGMSLFYYMYPFCYDFSLFSHGNSVAVLPPEVGVVLATKIGFFPKIVPGVKLNSRYVNAYLLATASMPVGGVLHPGRTALNCSMEKRG